ncbi:MAG: hypothetical protein Q3963_07465, partial [Coriobacteriaceae bacterium]|nr:hypothetical protein [Coriobacteriaceae bacterium]
MPGHVAADMITAGMITAGYIRDQTGGFFIDLDNHEYSMPASVTVGGKTVKEIADDSAEKAVDDQTQEDIFNKLTNNGALQGLYMSNGALYVNASYI